MVAEGLRRTGYDEVSLTSLSTADFSGIERVVADIVNDPVSCGQVSVSPPEPAGRRLHRRHRRADRRTARRTGLTFAPEAGTWRLRPVINKLITEEDLYGAVESAYSQGWTRMKLYFLTGLPTETDEDTLGIAELAKKCVAIGKRYTPPCLGHGRRRRVRAEAAHAVPVVRPEHRRRAAAQGRHAARRDPARHAGVQLKWHDPRATLAEGIASRGDRRIGAVIEHVWRAGGTFQEWRECFDLDPLAEAMAARWPVDRLVRASPPHRGRGASLGAHLGRPARRLPVAGLAGRARRVGRRGLPLDALLRLRRLHGLRHRARRGLGAPRPGAARAPGRTSLGRRGAGSARTHRRVRAAHEPRCVSVSPSCGKVRFTSHRDVARMLERAFRARRDAGRLHRGVLAPAPPQLRPRTLDRARVARPSTSTSTWSTTSPSIRRLARGALRRRRSRSGIDVVAVAADRCRHAPSLQQDVTSCHVAARARRRRPPKGPGGRGRCAGVPPRSWRPHPKGPASRSTTSARRCWRSTSTRVEPSGDVTFVAELATQPRALRPAELARRVCPDVDDVRALRTHQWIERDGARWEPSRASDAHRRTRRR